MADLIVSVVDYVAIKNRKNAIEEIYFKRR